VSGLLNSAVKYADDFTHIVPENTDVNSSKHVIYDVMTYKRSQLDHDVQN